MNKKMQVVSVALKLMLLVLVSFLTTFRAIYYFLPRGVECVSDWLTILTPCVWINGQFEVLMWVFVLILLVLVLIIDKEGRAFFQTCKQNWLIFLFSILAFISLSWTIHIEITLYKAFVLFCVSLLAIYIGHTFRLVQILKLLILYFVFLTSVNLLYVIALPSFGIMQDPFYQGAWHGLFWHRNYLGCFMALGVVIILVNLLSKNVTDRGELYLNLLLLTLSVFLIIKSKSATAIISGLVSIGLIFILYVWTKVHQRMKSAHYYGIFIVVITGVSLVLYKLDFFLGFLGRNSSLTGRIPMWQSLFQYLISPRPWLGYGYGVIWHLQGIREGMADIVNWPYPVMIADNGFIDILLHLGIVGLLVLTALIVIGFIRGVKYFLFARTIEAAFPIIILVFAILANVSLSLILESESFVWLLPLVIFTSISKSTPLVLFDKIPHKSVASSTEDQFLT